MPPLPEDTTTGLMRLHEPSLNKGTAFTEDERSRYRLRGLLPPRVFTQAQQAERVLLALRKHSKDLDKYVDLMDLQDRNQALFYRLIIDNLEELMPLVYTPTVGQACLEYGLIFRRPRGLFIRIEDAGQVSHVVANWRQDDVRVIVVTDGERILGLGDLGAHGMGIPVGKLALYVACAGIRPEQCLPITLDVGTDNAALQQELFYMGMPHKRVRGADYNAFIAEFIAAIQERYPRALIQFEDFGNHNAFRLLNEYQSKICTFNDDIQGTASVTLAGILGALKIKNEPLSQQKFLFLGAGEAGIGIGDLIVATLVEEGMSHDEARQLCWFVDSKGLVVADRTDLVEHKRRFAHTAPPIAEFYDAIEHVQPTAIIGVSGQPGTFTAQVLERMAQINERPIIFALSNPTSKSECNAADAYYHTEGRAIFASGSPFPTTKVDGKVFEAGQANNVYIFPGVGLGVVASGARHVTDDMFASAAKAVVRLIEPSDLEVGRVFPSLKRIREVSLEIAVDVAEVAYRDQLATVEKPGDLRDTIRSMMYDPVY